MRVCYAANVLEGLAVHPQVRWVLRSQLLVTLLAGLVAGLTLGMNAAVSAVLGGGIAIASALAYAWRALRSARVAVDARRALNAQMLGEGYKFAVTLLLFSLVFTAYAALVPLPFFLAYAATIVVYWIALLRQR